MHGHALYIGMKTNRNFKNSVFTALFSEPAVLRDLYNALGGVSLPADVPVSINTLENVVFMDIYNDISFEIGGKLVILVEHQSSINPNMALRLLLYYARVLEKTVKGKTLYSEIRLSIPWPEFYVLYNGIKPYPDEQILRLSDLFENPFDLGLPEKLKPLLELEVKVININEGRNDAIVHRCRKLAEYSAFTAKTRALLQELGSKEEAIKQAVIYCRNHDILSAFLEIHGSEVLNMLLTEWNWDDAKEVWQDEAREERTLEIARKMIKAGQSINEIAEFTDLPFETIDQIK